MTVTAPETAVREAVIDALNAEFTGDAIGFVSDKLNDSLGQNGPVGAVYPSAAEEMLNQGLVQTTTCYIQLFHQWTPEVNPQQAVDPGLIEESAERVRRALQNASFSPDEHLWFFRVTKVEYPDDPTGNKSRLLATVVATSQNAALVETSG